MFTNKIKIPMVFPWFSPNRIEILSHLRFRHLPGTPPITAPWWEPWIDGSHLSTARRGGMELATYGLPKIGGTHLNDLNAWWFGTWMDYDSPFSWECHHPNCLIFFRGAAFKFVLASHPWDEVPSFCDFVIATDFYAHLASTINILCIYIYNIICMLIPHVWLVNITFWPYKFRFLVNPQFFLKFQHVPKHLDLVGGWSHCMFISLSTVGVWFGKWTNKKRINHPQSVLWTICCFMCGQALEFWCKMTQTDLSGWCFGTFFGTIYW
jgi:hypothetical protein